MEIGAVIFDCDGVLVDSEILGLEESAAYLAAHGLSCSREELVRRFTGLRDDVFAEKLKADYVDANAKVPPAGFFEGLIEARRRRRNELQPVKGAADALSAIVVPKAVASSSRGEYLESKLRRTGLWRFVEPHVYSGDLVAQGKPAPDIFLFAAARLGVAPSRCLVVEDSTHGVIGARAAGMMVCGFTAGGHCFDGHGESLLSAGADWLAADFPSLLERIQR